MFILHIYLLFFIVLRYFTGADSNKHAKDALTQEVEKMEAALLSKTTPEGVETVPENPHKAPRLEAQPDSSSSRKSSLKGLFEEILQEHDEERALVHKFKIKYRHS